MLLKLSCLVLLATVILLVTVLVKMDRKEPFAYSYDPKCLKTCSVQSTNAPDQCMNDCQMPCNNKCWENCFKKSAYFDDYLRCGVQCPFGYFSS